MESIDVNDILEKGCGRGRRPIANARRVTKKTRLNNDEIEKFDKMKDYYEFTDSELIRAALRNMWQRYIMDIQKKVSR